MMQKKEQLNYESYVAKQVEKTSDPIVIESLKDESEIRFQRFKDYFETCGLLGLLPPASGSSILCLGARLGTEVRALRELGYARAIGVDLYPLSDLVEFGDFHNLHHDDDSFDGVYSNSLDHCYELKKVLLEAERVLKPNGVMVLNIGVKTGMGEYETIMIESPDEVIEHLSNCEVLSSTRKSFKLYKHGGLNFELILRKKHEELS